MADPLNAVIDISHHNGNVNLTKAAADGILGVIIKATQGQSGSDPQYKANRKKAIDAGLLYGAYHFGTSSDGLKQADNFLTVVSSTGDDPRKVLLVLDFESNPAGPSMDLEEARSFVTHINDKTGRFPGFYSGHDIKAVLGSSKDPILSQCWFWLAQYGPTPVVPPNWPTWTMWQYTDGANGPQPHSVAGVGACDRDKFNGTAAQLKKLWAGT